MKIYISNLHYFMEYNPSAFLSADRGSSGKPTADLIILNQPIQDFETFKKIWRHTRYRICADGGANRLYDMLSGPLEEYRTHFVSHIIPRHTILARLIKSSPASRSNPRRPRLSKSINIRILRQEQRYSYKRRGSIQHRFR